jgi:aminoglycoside 6'-N-acetyltransferase I
MRIVAVGAQDHELIAGMAEVLIAAFEEHSPDSWPGIPSAVEEIAEGLQPGRIVLAAVGESDLVLGWIGGRFEYARVWELHPLAVDPRHHRKGIGRALVAELERRAKALGCLTLRLGTDDEDDQTSLSGTDLHEDTWEKVRDIRNLRGHAFEFYQRCGYTVVGVIPDANGVGRPDILMAKRLT